jgi:hypothetical protein
VTRPKYNASGAAVSDRQFKRAQRSTDFTCTCHGVSLTNEWGRRAFHARQAVIIADGRALLSCTHTVLAGALTMIRGDAIICAPCFRRQTGASLAGRPAIHARALLGALTELPGFADAEEEAS